MASFRLASASEKQVWSAAYTSEYVRESGFLPYMGTADTSIIRVDKKLTGEAGAVVHFPYFKKLSSAGVTGSTTLYGSEEVLSNGSCGVRVSLRRNGVSVPESETFRTEIDVANAARASLKNWSGEMLRNDLITAFQSVPIAGGVDSNGDPLEDTAMSYAAASATQKNTFYAANSDRVLYAKNAYYNATHATALASITATDKISAAMIMTAKNKAKASSPYKITPYKSDSTAGREWYVLFVGPEGMRDANLDPIIYDANKNARERGLEDNPIFQSGDLIYSGVIIRLIDELPVVGAVGAASAVVGHAVLCGQNAVAVAYSKMPEPRTQTFDFGHVNSVAIMEIRGQQKMSIAGVQTGVVSLFHAAAPDA